MKRKILLIFVIFFGMTIFAQDVSTGASTTATPTGTGPDMSYYTQIYNRPGTSFADRLELLRTLQNANLTGNGGWYHDALKLLLLRTPDIRTTAERDAMENSARIICRALAAEQYIQAAADLWQLVQIADPVRPTNDGLVMQEALIALGQIGATDYVPHIALRLDNFNTAVTSDTESRRRIQRGVVGCINALQALHDPRGYSPVLFAYMGWYDPAIKTIADDALPNIVDDPGEIISGIIRTTNNPPNVKYTALQEMLRSRAPNESKAATAAAALATGWTYSTGDPNGQRVLREMRMTAIDTIRQTGIADDSVYADLQRSYSNNYMSAAPNYDEIRRVLSTLSILKTDQAVGLLMGFLSDLNGRRQFGPWGNKERDVFSWLVPSLGATGTQSEEVKALLSSIQRSSYYTSTEQNWARDALRELSL